MVVGVHRNRARIDIGHGAARGGHLGAVAGVIVQVVTGARHGAAHTAGVVGPGRTLIGGADGDVGIDIEAAERQRHRGVVDLAARIAALGKHGQLVVDLEVEAQIDVVALVLLAALDEAHQRRRVIVPLVQATDQLIAAGVAGLVARGIAVEGIALGIGQCGEGCVAVGLGLGGGGLGQDLERRGGIERAAGSQRRAQGGRVDGRIIL